MITWLRRRVLPLLLVVAMLASYLPVSAFAEGEDTKTLEVKVGNSLDYREIANELGISINEGLKTYTYRIFDATNNEVYPGIDWNNFTLEDLGKLVPWTPNASVLYR